MYPHPQSLDIHAYIAHPCRLHGCRMVTTGIWENHFGSQKTNKTDAYLCSFPKLLQTQSLRFFITSQDSFHSWNCDSGTSSFLLQNLLTCALCQSSFLDPYTFYPAGDEYVLLIHNGMCIRCGCAACLCILGTVNEMRSLYFSSKYFSSFWLPGSFIYLCYLLSSPCARLQSIDKNWFSSCE